MSTSVRVLVTFRDYFAVFKNLTSDISVEAHTHLSELEATFPGDTTGVSGFTPSLLDKSWSLFASRVWGMAHLHLRLLSD